MRRTLIGALVAAVTFGLIGAAPAHAGPTEPTFTSYNTTPDSVTFSANSSTGVSLTVEVDEPAGWTLTAARYTACAAGGRFGYCEPREQWLKLDSSNAVLQRRLIVFTGAIPNIETYSGQLVRWDTYQYVTLTYRTPQGASRDFVQSLGYFNFAGATRATIDGPSRITPGHSLTLSGQVACFGRTSYEAPQPGVYGYAGGVAVEFRKEGESTWRQVDGAEYDTATGKWSYFNLAVGASGDWRARYTSYGESMCRNAYSSALHVEASDTAPPPPPAEVANAPTVRVTGHAYNTISLTWSAPTQPHGTIQGYRWGWTSDNGLPQRTWDYVFSPDMPNPFVMTNLAPSNKYTIWLEAITEHGTGRRTTVVDTTSAAPRADRPPTAPRSPKVANGYTSAKLFWTAPSSNGGSTITGYQTSLLGKTSNVSSSARSFTWSGLTMNKSYTLYVRAKNAIGYGPWTRASARTLLPKAAAYSSCTSLNKVYPHGVGRSGATDHTSGARVTNWFHYSAAYYKNDGRVVSRHEYDLDRDNDGIACEKR